MWCDTTQHNGLVLIDSKIIATSFVWEGFSLSIRSTWDWDLLVLQLSIHFTTTESNMRLVFSSSENTYNKEDDIYLINTVQQQNNQPAITSSGARYIYITPSSKRLDWRENTWCIWCCVLVGDVYTCLFLFCRFYIYLYIYFYIITTHTHTQLTSYSTRTAQHTQQYEHRTEQSKNEPCCNITLTYMMNAYLLLLTMMTDRPTYGFPNYQLIFSMNILFLPRSFVIIIVSLYCTCTYIHVKRDTIMMMTTAAAATSKREATKYKHKRAYVQGNNTIINKYTL